jgi:diguanylate cyclase (GGDEF)-like protein
MSGFTKRVCRGCGLWLRASLQPATPLGLIMIAACWLALAYATSVERAKTLEGAISRSGNITRLFEESTDQTLLGIDRTLMLLRKGYEDAPDHFDLRNWAERTAVTASATIQISIVGSDGFMKATTTDYSGPPLYLGDREHFLAHVDSGVDTLFISKPVIGRASGKWSIQLSRGIWRKDGVFGGIIIASLDPDFIQAFYETVNLGSHGTIILRRLDGVILASRGLLSPALGRQAVLQPLPDALVEPPTGHYWGRGNIDGVKRLIAYRFDAKFPVIETVGRAESDVFETYLHDRNTYLAVAVFITILVLFAIMGAAHYQIRLDRVRDNLRRSEAEAIERAHALELKSRELEVTLDYMGQGIIMTDADGNVRVTNRQAITLLGLPELFRFDRPMTKGLVPDPAKPEADGLALELLDPGIDEPRKPGAGSMDIQVYQRTLPDGAVLEIHSAQLQEGGTVRTIGDITERKRAEQEIERIAHHDALTGLANRPLLHSRIDQALGRMRRYEESFAILCIDLDRFKIVNDTFGHQAGDVILRQVTDRLLQCARDIDTVARIGGDEFVVLQANVGKPEDVTPLAKRILLAMSAPCDINGNPVVIGASIGIALAPSDGATADELLRHADLALYRSKSNRRNDFCFFDAEIGQSATRRVKLDLELREALARGQFELWYQPWINIASGRIAGCEALLRWRHPVRGLISPMEFIPTAEETGLIRPLGDWVLRRACRDACGWPNHIKLAVNLSAAQFLGGRLSESVLDALAEAGLEAKRLEIEITETLIIDDYEGPREALRQMRDHGIRVALDDFGTGYSSLTHLRQLLIDRIKIDRSFVAEITTRADCAAIVSAVIALGNSLGVAITAEGVETRDQLVILRAAGCTEAQGYLFSRPKPAAEILKILQSDGADVIAA